VASPPHSPIVDLDESGAVPSPVILVSLDGDDVARRPPSVLAGNGGRLLIGVATRPLRQPLEGLRPVLDALDLTLVPVVRPAAGSADPARRPGDAVPGEAVPGEAVPGEAAVPRQCVAVADPEAESHALAQAVAARFPQAALVLGQVLRASESLPVPEALNVESFAYSMLLGGAEFRRWLDGNAGRPLPALVADPVLVERDGDQLLVRLNRPQRRNAYGRQLRDALADALRVAVLDPSVSRVVLDGAGPCFCSGGDLAEFGTAPDLVTAHFVRTLGGAGRLASQLRDRLEVRVHGPCVGAGVELPAFAGTVIAAGGTTFTLPEVAMGLLPGAGGTVSIPRRVGRWRALYLALSGRPLEAATALEWGLIDEIASPAPPQARGRRLPSLLSLFVGGDAVGLVEGALGWRQ
jgi:enoyl-CoA hydratase/carnithine racemase